ncbi:MAG: zinc ABC transporter substrate-binding protein [Thermodesulfobacteriota bacterium]|nr:zinc ABC transporter substrate-binding protein [Thermodesulfobacteriota bacterium]
MSAATTTPSGEKIRAFVSILPQAYFLERVGGDRVEVSVMVGPGHSPHTYEATPIQMAELSEARLYFRIGVDFENVWMERVSKINPDMKVVDTRRGIELRPMRNHRHEEAHNDHEAKHHEHHRQGRPTEHHNHVGPGMKDRHIWLSPRLVKIQAKTICEALIKEDPSNRAYYEANMKAFHRDLDQLDREIARSLKDIKSRKFMVFHPSWGYFAHDYGLEQIPIEMEGKEPTAKSLHHVIEEAKEEGIKIIFVQKQFSKARAETVARAIGGRVVQIDPLARDYLSNMRQLAHTFEDALK